MIFSLPLKENQAFEYIVTEKLKILQRCPWFSTTFDSSTLKMIGNGAFGVVFSVYHNNFKRKVALKVIESAAEDLNEVIDELVKMKTLKHPNILEILEHRLILHDKLYLLLVMEQGITSLNNYLAEKPMGMTEKELYEAMKALSSAVSYAHQNNIVHCDIKPANIILFKNNSKNIDLDYIPKISDWGSAYEFKEFNHHSETGKKTGMHFTPLFLAPELQNFEEGKSKIKKGNFFSGDVYALGITLLRCAGINKLQEIKGLSGEQDKEFYEPKLKKILTQLTDKGLSADIIEKIRRMILFDSKERVFTLVENKIEVIESQNFIQKENQLKEQIFNLEITSAQNIAILKEKEEILKENIKKLEKSLFEQKDLEKKLNEKIDNLEKMCNKLLQLNERKYNERIETLEKKNESFRQMEVFLNEKVDNLQQSCVLFSQNEQKLNKIIENLSTENSLFINKQYQDLKIKEIKHESQNEEPKIINGQNQIAAGKLSTIDSLKLICKTIHTNHSKHFEYLAKLLKHHKFLANLLSFNFSDGIETLPKKLCLLYRASEHNFSASKFHQICDGKGPTLTIVRSTSKTLFGGYASKSWFSGDRYEAAPDSFLFSLDKETRHEIYQYETNAMRGSKDWGPCFGGSMFGGDLTLSDKCDCGSTSYSDLGQTYSLPKGMHSRSDAAQSYLGGSYPFQVEEYEVFRIN